MINICVDIYCIQFFPPFFIIFLIVFICKIVIVLTFRELVEKFLSWCILWVLKYENNSWFGWGGFSWIMFFNIEQRNPNRNIHKLRVYQTLIFAHTCSLSKLKLQLIQLASDKFSACIDCQAISSSEIAPALRKILDPAVVIAHRFVS